MAMAPHTIELARMKVFTNHIDLRGTGAQTQEEPKLLRGKPDEMMLKRGPCTTNPHSEPLPKVWLCSIAIVRASITVQRLSFLVGSSRSSPTRPTVSRDARGTIPVTGPIVNLIGP